jgi:hypothetical protein
MPEFILTTEQVETIEMLRNLAKEENALFDYCRPEDSDALVFEIMSDDNFQSGYLPADGIVRWN